MLMADRDRMITDPDFPSLTLASISFGKPAVMLVLRMHLFELVKAMGISTTADTIQCICDDIISGYGDLKISEIILAFKMIREGKFRNGNDNRGQFYGSLSSQVICDCLYNFRYEYRNKVLDRYENEQRIARKFLEEQQAASYDEYITIIVDTIAAESNDPQKQAWLLYTFKPYIQDKDMKQLEIYIQQQQQLISELSGMKTQIESLEYLKDAVLKMETLPQDKQLRGVARLIELAKEYNNFYGSVDASNNSANQ